MSHRRRRRRDPGRLLTRLAAALNACDRAGLKTRLCHGGVIETRHGYAIRTPAGWVARTLAWSEFGHGKGDDDD